jgi:ELWxxDGT repeat protein/cysteine-rich repeat protein
MELTNVDGRLFFVAYDATSGFELWKSDGTEESTVLVKDIRPGWHSSMPSELTKVHGTLFFCAYGPDSGSELWKSDGTEAGTVLVKDINPGADHSFPANLTDVNGTLFFSADDGTHGSELWRSDGTGAGTVLVKDICLGPETSDLGPLSYENQTGFADLNRSLFFAADDGTSGRELWRSDGTEEGTQQLADIVPGSGGSSPRALTVAGPLLFFSAEDDSAAEELWAVQILNCGDGILDPAEQCDDGNEVDGDGCDSDCVWTDSDSDGVPDDGDGSTIMGDTPCAVGQSTGCDDNCPAVPNADQADEDENGIGNACQCGDVNGDGFTNVTDTLMIVRGQVASGSEAEAFGDVNGDTFCNITDALIIARGLQGSAHQDQQCPAYHGQ